MAELFTAKYQMLWAVVLALLLFYPVRQLIWTLTVRRAERDGQDDAERRHRLKRRANVTAILLSFVFALFYTLSLFRPPQ